MPPLSNSHLVKVLTSTEIFVIMVNIIYQVKPKLKMSEMGGFAKVLLQRFPHLADNLNGQVGRGEWGLPFQMSV